MGNESGKHHSSDPSSFPSKSVGIPVDIARSSLPWTLEHGLEIPALAPVFETLLSERAELLKDPTVVERIFSIYVETLGRGIKLPDCQTLVQMLEAHPALESVTDVAHQPGEEPPLLGPLHGKDGSEDSWILAELESISFMLVNMPDDLEDKPIPGPRDTSAVPDSARPETGDGIATPGTPPQRSGEEQVSSLGAKQGYDPAVPCGEETALHMPRPSASVAPAAGLSGARVVAGEEEEEDHSVAHPHGLCIGTPLPSAVVDTPVPSAAVDAPEDLYSIPPPPPRPPPPPPPATPPPCVSGGDLAAQPQSPLKAVAYNPPTVAPAQAHPTSAQHVPTPHTHSPACPPDRTPAPVPTHSPAQRMPTPHSPAPACQPIAVQPAHPSPPQALYHPARPVPTPLSPVPHAACVSPRATALPACIPVAASPALSPHSPHLLLGRYKVLRAIGKGSTGHVYLALDFAGPAVNGAPIAGGPIPNSPPLSPGLPTPPMPRPVAIKAVCREGLSAEHLRIVLNERRYLALFEELPNIVRLLDFQVTEDYILLFLEYCSEGALSDILKAHPQGLKERHARALLKQMVNGLLHLWERSIFHRDLKPHNLLLTRRQGALTLVVADFGLTRHVHADHVAQTICGTGYYMAPEVMNGCRYNLAADLWSVGVILFEMVTGRRPFTGRTRGEQTELCKHVPPLPDHVSVECRQLIHALLQFDPRRRCTFEQLLQAPFLTRRCESHHRFVPS